jgi:hypothetical protein
LLATIRCLYDSGFVNWGRRNEALQDRAGNVRVRMRRALRFAAIGLLISAALELLAPAAALCRSAIVLMVSLTTLITPPILTLLIRRTADRTTD